MSNASEPAAGPPAQAAEAGLSRRRAILVWSLVVVASLLLLISSLTIWVKRQVIDTSGYVDTSAQMLENDEIRTTLADYIVNTVFARVDVTAQLQEQLPSDTDALAPIAASALRQLSLRTANQVLESGRVQDAWEEANRRAHEQLIAVLNDEDTGAFVTERGAVVLDLNPLIERVGESGGFGKRLTAQLPADAGRITVLRSDQLETAQAGFRLLRALTVFLAIAALALYALAIFLARGRRRNILRGAALSFLFVGLLVLVVRRYVGDGIVESLVKTESVKPAGSAAWQISTSMLREIGLALIVYGAVALVGVWLAGETRPAVAIRRWIAPYIHDRPGTVYGIVGFLYLLLLLWGPTPALHRWWGILLLAGLVFLGVAALRRQMLDEHAAVKAA
jgi:hypothetical protein